MHTPLPPGPQHSRRTPSTAASAAAARPLPGLPSGPCLGGHDGGELVHLKVVGAGYLALLGGGLGDRAGEERAGPECAMVARYIGMRRDGEPGGHGYLSVGAGVTA